MVARDSLPSDFFDRAQVEAQVKSAAENLLQAQELGLTPLWLDENYQSDFGILSLPPEDAIFVNAADSTAEVHYALIVPTSSTDFEPLLDSIVIRLSLDPTTFGPPAIPGYAGDLPEEATEVTVSLQPAVLYSSLLTASDLPCESATCPLTSAPLYRRIVFAVGDTWVQIEASSRIDAGGADRNGFNSIDGLVELAQALLEVT
jgi:hypothetical protein